MSLELREYRSLPAMTADELIATANEFLAARGASLISKRTLRFYTAQGVVPVPLGSPKYARYGYEHLLSMLAARSLQDQGMRLEQIRFEIAEIQTGRLNRIEGRVEAWLENKWPHKGKLLAAKETSVADPESAKIAKLAQMGSTFIRLPLGPNVSLEISDTITIESDLNKAYKEFGKLITSFTESKN